MSKIIPEQVQKKLLQIADEVEMRLITIVTHEGKFQYDKKNKTFKKLL